MSGGTITVTLTAAELAELNEALCARRLDPRRHTHNDAALESARVRIAEAQAAIALTPATPRQRALRAWRMGDGAEGAR